MDFRKRRRLNLIHPDPRKLRNYSAVYMSTRSKQKPDEDAEFSKRTVWTHDDEKALLSALREYVATISDGSIASLSLDEWKKVASSIGKDGSSKTGDSCRTKWSRVSDSILMPSIFVDNRTIAR
jgi:Myb-like DNA-binding domain